MQPFQLLLVAATTVELQPLLQHFGATENPSLPGMPGLEFTTPQCRVVVCITGAGILHTAYHVSNALQLQHFTLAVAAGIAGSFTPKLQIGSIVEVCRQQMADLGAENHRHFIPIEQMPFYNPNLFPYRNGCLYNPNPGNLLFKEQLPCVTGITVNTVSGRKSTIQLRRKLYEPDVESMEGAAFFYTCLMQQVSFAEIRAISNFAEPRNPLRWNIPLAINNLCRFLTRFIEQLPAQP